MHRLILPPSSLQQCRSLFRTESTIMLKRSVNVNSSTSRAGHRRVSPTHHHQHKSTLVLESFRGQQQHHDRLTWKQMKALLLSSAIPMVGFGFMDNLVMIQAGSYIDNTLGVQFGLATLTAAAMGQVVSDMSGVLFGGSLERMLSPWIKPRR